MTLMGQLKYQLLLVTVLVLAAAAVYVWVVEPVRNERDAAIERLEQKRKELDILTRNADPRSQATGKELVELSIVRRSVPERPYREQLLQDMRMLEAVTRLDMSDYHFETAASGSSSSRDSGALPSGTPASVTPIRLNTSVKGTYVQIYRMLDEIQTMPRLIRIERLEFSTDASPPVKLNANDRQITCRLTLTAYYAPELQAYFQTPMPVRFRPDS